MSSQPTKTASESSARDDLREQVQSLREDLSELGRLSKEAAREVAQDAREKATGYYRRGKERAEYVEDQAMDYVREHPMKSVLVAAGIGAIVGALWSRR